LRLLRLLVEAERLLREAVVRVRRRELQRLVERDLRLLAESAFW
jgi:hypothetical protein